MAGNPESMSFWPGEESKTNWKNFSWENVYNIGIRYLNDYKPVPFPKDGFYNWLKNNNPEYYDEIMSQYPENYDWNSYEALKQEIKDYVNLYRGSLSRSINENSFYIIYNGKKYTGIEGFSKIIRKKFYDTMNDSNSPFAQYKSLNWAEHYWDDIDGM